MVSVRKAVLNFVRGYPVLNNFDLPVDPVDPFDQITRGKDCRSSEILSIHKMPSDIPVPPQVLWAQRKEDVLLTLCVETKDPIIKIEKDSVYFKGSSAPDNKPLEVTIPLYDTVVPETSAFVNKGRCIEIVLRKEKKDASYWPSLTKDKKKPHYLKVDFNKWKDEDDEEEEGGGGGGGGGGGNYDFEEMLRSMGGGGIGPAGDKGKPSFDDVESDSDDENLPDLE